MPIVPNDSVAVRQRVAAFASSAEGTSLYLLRTIEQTVDALSQERRMARLFAELANSLAAELAKRQPAAGQYLDPDDTAIDSLEKAYRSLDEYLPSMVSKKASIDHDGNLAPDHTELLHGAYDDSISAMAELIESLKAARDAIIAHDLKAEPRNEADYRPSVGGLLESLHA